MSNFEFDVGIKNDGDKSFESNSGGRSGTIFLIDAAQEMFQGDLKEDEDVPFKQALKCAHLTISRKARYCDSDLTAIILFNTRESLNARTDFLHIYILQDLDRPGAERVLKIEEVLKGSDSKFEKKYGHSNNASINEALWVCQTMFSNCKSKLVAHSVLIFTTCDDPHHDDQQKARQAKQRARDMRDAGITIELLHIGHHFDVSKLYRYLILDVEDKESQVRQTLTDPTSRLDELEERVRRLEHNQRATDRVIFNLAPGIEMSVSLYTSLTRITYPSKMKLWKTTNEEVCSVKKEYYNGKLLLPSDYVMYQTYGEKKIKFNLDEIREMSKVYDQGMQLLGFKPIKVIKPYYHIRTANFIYPDEKNIQGSTKMFAALLDRCIARKVAAIVRLVTRINTSVSWAALIPQMEERDNKNNQVSPSGFHVCFLPFADDFRDIEFQNRTRANPDQVAAAKEVMKKLHFRYSLDSFENPDLQTHWHNIEALALNRSHLEEVPDYTVPNYFQIEKTTGQLLSNLSEMVFKSKVQKRSSYSSLNAATKPTSDFSKTAWHADKINQKLNTPLTPIHKSNKNVADIQSDTLDSTSSIKLKNNIEKCSEDNNNISPVELSSIVFDLETNGLTRKYHNIIQISALDISDSSSNMFNAYIFPNSEFDPKSSAVNGFYMKSGCLCKNGKELNAVTESKAIIYFLDWLKKRKSKCILIAHNGTRFDVPRLLDLINKHNLFNYFVDLVYGFVDTLKVFKSVYPLMDKYNQCHLVKMILDVDYDAHDGIEDVIALAKLVTHNAIYVEYIIITNIDRTPLRVKYNDDTFVKHTFGKEVTLKPLYSPNVTSAQISLSVNAMLTPENEKEMLKEFSKNLEITN